MVLFDQQQADEPLEPGPGAPLAARMRPRTLEEFVGQEHFLGAGQAARRMIEADRLASLIFYGPPGTGKTALAHVIAHARAPSSSRSTPSPPTSPRCATVIARAAERKRRAGRRTLLFVDEMHRFNRAQQDVLLPDVENGTVILIGATTHNPFFSINSPLLSRSQIFEFEPLTRGRHPRHPRAARWPTRSAASATYAVEMRRRRARLPGRASATATPAARSTPWRSAC